MKLEGGNRRPHVGVTTPERKVLIDRGHDWAATPNSRLGAKRCGVACANTTLGLSVTTTSNDSTGIQRPGNMAPTVATPTVDLQNIAIAKELLPRAGLHSGDLDVHISLFLGDEPNLPPKKGIYPGILRIFRSTIKH